MKFLIILILVFILTSSNKFSEANENDKELIEDFRSLLIKQGSSQFQIKDDFENLELNWEKESYLNNWLADNKRSSDGILLNWIEFYDNNLEKAAEQLQKTLEWKRINKLEESEFWEPPQILYNSLPFKITGIDAENTPVIYLEPGSWDIKKFLKKGYKLEMIKYAIKIVENTLTNLDDKYNDTFTVTADDNSTFYDEGISKLNLIVNLKNFSFKQATSIKVLLFFTELLKVFENNYPLLFKNAIVINAPNYGIIFFDIMNRVLSSKSLEAIKFFNENEEDWKNAIIEAIPDPYLIPKEIGGFA